MRIEARIAGALLVLGIAAYTDQVRAFAAGLLPQRLSDAVTVESEGARLETIRVTGWGVVRYRGSADVVRVNGSSKSTTMPGSTVAGFCRVPYPVFFAISVTLLPGDSSIEY